MISSAHESHCVTLALVGHRDAGAGIDDDPTGPADRAQQPFQFGFGNVGDRGRMPQRERRDRGGQRVDVLGRCPDTVAQHFAHQIGEHRVVGARPGCEMVRREPRRLGMAGVDDPDLGVLREVADAPRGFGRPTVCPWETTGLLPMNTANVALS